MHINEQGWGSHSNSDIDVFCIKLESSYSVFSRRTDDRMTKSINITAIPAKSGTQLWEILEMSLVVISSFDTSQGM